MGKTKRRLLSVLAAALTTLVPPASVAGEVYPTKPVFIVVPFPAGGGPDLAARILAEKLSPRLGQPTVVENRPGASSMVGVRAVANAAPDGHTLLLTAITSVIARHVLFEGALVGVDFRRDLVPIVAPATTPMVLVANPGLGVKDLGDLIARARANPGIAYGSAGTGSGTHFAGEMLKRSAKIDLLHVPYRGVAPAIIGTLRGDTPLLFSALGAALPYIRSGKLVTLAVTEQKRSVLLPNTPTATEQGVPEVEVHAWYGIFAPIGTPAPIIGRINQEINAILNLDAVKEKFQASGIEILGGQAELLGKLVDTDDKRYGSIARELNIRLD